MLAMIDKGGYVDSKTGETVFSYAHPIFWAPFSLIGDGGGGKPASQFIQSVNVRFGSQADLLKHSS